MTRRKKMLRLLCCLICAAVLAILTSGNARAQRVMYERPKMAKGPSALEVILEPYLDKYDLPALGAAVVRDGKIQAMGAVGTKAAGQQIPVTTGDRFHIGSDTKAMTALLAAMYVEAGKLRWDSKVEEIFPELKKTLAAGWGQVTLEGLLSHTSGILDDGERFGKLLQGSFEQGDLDLRGLRYWMLSKFLTQPIAAAPRKQFAYSNIGYMIAGAMIERVAGRSWEELMLERVFVPLRLRSAGFGPQSTVGTIDAPLPHKIVDGNAKPMLAGPNADNPLVLGPAGTVHMSLQDFARWAIWNLGRGKRGPGLVRAETLARLTTPVVDIPPGKDAAPGTPSGGRYALGWGEREYPWAKGPFLTHAGSNGMNLAHIVLDPRTDFGMVLMTNIGGKKADEALRGLEEELHKRYGK
ncbi:MAG: D-alanyl-D-alanine carboxypeptidase precursor [Syntrophorhabdus sp. PtaB.Bin047]|nr:MAG: D-alanyl-D-alanine carboxypeptidase precursor [Syntrophorhabdus sp. PtaB.Bin047]